MGEQQLDVVASDTLTYIPASEFAQLRARKLDPSDEARVFAAMCRVNVLYMIARAWSGHIGTSFSSLDIMSWVFLNELKGIEHGPASGDVFFSSKGHDAPALYAVLIGLGLLPEEKLHQLRRLGGLPGHPHVRTPFIQANTGSLGMGISKAKGMALANRLSGKSAQIFVLTGDGELQEGQFWESLPSAVNLNLSEITVIIDHNLIQSDTWVRDVSDLGNLAAKLTAFGWHVETIDGHDIDAVRTTLAALRGITSKPKVVIANTVKGKGVPFMEGPAMKPDGLYEYHSGAPNEHEYALASQHLQAEVVRLFAELGLPAPAVATATRPARKPVLDVERLVAAYTRALIDQAGRHPQLVALDADLVKDCGLVEFRARYPERFVECGIAEQDMVSMASGMAARGALPVVHSFACFLSSRPNEQIYNQASEGRKVIYVGSLAGLLPGGPGHSHQAVRDISSLGAIPQLVMVEPTTEAECEALFDFLVNRTPESGYLRLVSLGWPVPFAHPVSEPLVLGRGSVVRDGTDAVVIGCGPWLLANAWHAAEQLATEGLSLRVVALPWLNRIDTAWLQEVVGDVPVVITADNHYVHGGQGDMVAAALASRAIPGLRVHQIGVAELPVCGTNDEVLAHHRLDVDGLVESFRTAIRGTRR